MYVLTLLHLYVQDNSVVARALSFLRMLPTITCASPLQLREANGIVPDDVGEFVIKIHANIHLLHEILSHSLSVVGCDNATFQHKCYQLVYKYLRDTHGRHTATEKNGLHDQLQVYMQLSPTITLLGKQK